MAIPSSAAGQLGSCHGTGNLGQNAAVEENKGGGHAGDESKAIYLRWIFWLAVEPTTWLARDWKP